MQSRFERLFARQLSRPSGFLGRFVLGAIWNKRNAALNDLTFASLDLQADDRVLDVGFGGGYLLGRMAAIVQCRVIAGVDASPAMAANAQRRFKKAVLAGKMDIRYASAEGLPFSDESFSKVSSVNSIFYWANPVAGLAEAYRVLDENGRLVLTFTCRQDLADKGFAQYGLNLYNESEIQAMLVTAGFHDLQASTASDRHRAFICMVGWK